MIGVVDPPTSGLGDRLGAWLALLALAELRQEPLLFFNDAWPNGTLAGHMDGQRNQNDDVTLALRCIGWPQRVLQIGHDEASPAPIYRLASRKADPLALQQMQQLMRAREWRTEQTLLPLRLRALDYANHTRTSARAS